MRRVSFSGDEKSIDSILSWYEDQRIAILDYRNKINLNLTNPEVLKADKFIGLTNDDINEYFQSSIDELEHLVCFDLISATEAKLRLDFLSKVYNKDKSSIAIKFRELEKIYPNKISLENHIIDTWKAYKEAEKKRFSEFIGLLNYRHWLAHGRYWKPKLGQTYNPDNTYQIVENIFNIIDDEK